MNNITIQSASHLKVDDLKAAIKARGAKFNTKDKKADLLSQLIQLLQADNSSENSTASSQVPVLYEDAEADDVVTKVRIEKPAGELICESGQVLPIIPDVLIDKIGPIKVGDNEVREKYTQNVQLPRTERAEIEIMQQSTSLVSYKDCLALTDNSKPYVISSMPSEVHTGEKGHLYDVSVTVSDNNKPAAELNMSNDLLVGNIGEVIDNHTVQTLFHVGVCKFDRIEIKDFKAWIEDQIGITIDNMYYYTDKLTGVCVVSLQSEEVKRRFIAAVQSGLGDNFKNSGTLWASDTDVSVATIKKNPALSQKILSTVYQGGQSARKQSPIESINRKPVEPLVRAISTLPSAGISRVVTKVTTGEADNSDPRSRRSILNRVGGLMLLRSSNMADRSAEGTQLICKRPVAESKPKVVLDVHMPMDSPVLKKFRTDDGAAVPTSATGDDNEDGATAKRGEEIAGRDYNNNDDALCLDELFRCTKAVPALYWLPVSNEKVERRRAMGTRYMGTPGAVAAARQIGDETVGGRFDPGEKATARSDDRGRGQPTREHTNPPVQGRGSGGY